MEQKVLSIEECVEQCKEIIELQNNFYKVKRNMIEALKKAMIENINQRLKHAQAHPFAFSAKGIIEVVLAYGPRSNQTRQYPYHWIHVGYIGDETELEHCYFTEQTKSWLSHAEFKLPTHTVYVLKEDAREFDMYNNALYLQYKEKDGPEWSLEDLIQTFLPDDICEVLYANKLLAQPKNKTEGTLAIGSDEFGKWKNTQDKLTKIRIESLFRMIHS